MTSTPEGKEEGMMLIHPSRVSPPLPPFDFEKVNTVTTAATTRPRASSLLSEALLSAPPTSPSMFEPVTQDSIAAQEASMSLDQYLLLKHPPPPLESRDQRLRRKAREQEEEEKAAAQQEQERRKWVRKTQMKLDREFVKQVKRDRKEYRSDSEASNQSIELTRSGEPKRIRDQQLEQGAEDGHLKKIDSAYSAPMDHDQDRPALAERPKNDAAVKKTWLPSMLRKLGDRRWTK
jgi:hypothetical protein